MKVKELRKYLNDLFKEDNANDELTVAVKTSDITFGQSLKSEIVDVCKGCDFGYFDEDKLLLLPYHKLVKKK